MEILIGAGIGAIVGLIYLLARGTKPTLAFSRDELRNQTYTVTEEIFAELLRQSERIFRFFPRQKRESRDEYETRIALEAEKTWKHALDEVKNASSSEEKEELGNNAFINEVFAAFMYYLLVEDNIEGSIMIQSPDAVQPPNTHKEALYQQQKGYCKGCNNFYLMKDLEVDHIISRKRGGTDHKANLQLLCGSCNRSKGSSVMGEWLERRGMLEPC